MGSTSDMPNFHGSIIPSVLKTKENLLSPKHGRKHHKKRHSPLLYNNLYNSTPRTKGQKHRRATTSGIDTRTGIGKRRSRSKKSDRYFLPSIIPSNPRTAGGTPWTRVSSQAQSRNSSYSVLSHAEVSRRSRTFRQRFEDIRPISPLDKELPYKLPSRPTDLPKSDGKIVQNIRFWKESTLISRTVETNSTNPASDSKMEDKMIPQTSAGERSTNDGTWTKRFPLANENGKIENKFYARHMALRDRLIEFENMHYREAVTRINRYREKLRRPLASRSKVISTRQATAAAAIPKTAVTEQQQNTLEKEHRSTTANPSPPGVRLSPSKEWQPYVLQFNAGNKVLKKSQVRSKAESNTEGSSQSMQRIRFKKNQQSRISPASAPEKQGNEIVNDECPVQGEKLLQVGDAATTVDTPPKKSKKDHTANANVTEKSAVEIALTDSTSSILIDIRQKLKVESSPITPAKSRNDQLETDPLDPRTGLGAKLKLLLQKSSMSERQKLTSNNPDIFSESMENLSHKGATKETFSSARKSRFKLNADVRFPTVTKIGSLTMFAEKSGEQKLLVDTAMQHNKGRQHHRKNDRTRGDLREQSLGGNMKLSIDNDGMEGDTPRYHKPMERHIPARKLNTAGNIEAEKVGLNGISISKLLKAPSSTTRKNRLKPHEKDTNHQEAIDRITSMAKTVKKGKQQKVLRITMVEPSSQVQKHNNLLKQRKDKVMQARHMLFDPNKLAITNLTAAILNSELLLRAPSSSPVDFLKSYQFSSVPKEEENEHDKRIGSVFSPKEGTAGIPGVPMNVADGLSPLTGQGQNFPVNSRLPMPRVSDLVDLQGLYEAMRKQGGTAPFQLPASSVGSRENLKRQHIDRVLLNKQPFYHYPYPYQNAKMLTNGPPVPLYVVTGAKAVHMISEKKKQNLPTGKHEKKALAHTHITQEPVKNIIHKTPFQEYPRGHYQHASDQLPKYQGYSGIRGITVSMKVPTSTVQLEQIKEH